MDLQKEKHEEFRQKYPDMVPDEDEEEETAPQADGAVTPTETISTPTESELSPQPPPEPSYVPEEIEGGDETEDDTKDG